MTTNFELHGGEILVNTTTSGDQLAPDMAQLGWGGFVVVWQDLSGEGGDPNQSIKAQLFDADGNKTGSEFLGQAVSGKRWGRGFS